tara:strand:- start:4257 stop:4871 length:615 start_codon:yes stop_codon:yes gene_type:complete
MDNKAVKIWLILFFVILLPVTVIAADRKPLVLNNGIPGEIRSADTLVRGDGTEIVSNLVQMVNTQTGTSATGTTAMAKDDTIPQNTEGDEYMTLAITPNNTNNTLIIQVVCVVASSESVGIGIAALFQDSTANALAVGLGMADKSANQFLPITFIHKMTAGTTSSTTFKVRAGSESGTTTFNGFSGSRYFGGVLASSITIWEVQ